MHLATRFEVWPLERLTPYERNARTHSPDQVAKLAASIAEFGFNAPILVASDTGIIAGHGRLAAARRVGLAEVPVMVLDHLTPAQRRAYVLADNRLAELAGWDVAILGAELAELDADGFDLEAAGFTDEELAALTDDGLLPDLPSSVAQVPVPGVSTATSDGDQQDQAPADGQAPAQPAPPPTLPGADDLQEVAAVVVSRPGDVWQLGPHRVMCGSSTDARDVARLMDGQRGQLLHADPPYGMGKEADGVANDNLRGKALDGFQMDWWGAYRPHLTANASAYVWGNAPDLWRLWYVAGLGESEPLEFRNEVVWHKGTCQGQLSNTQRMFPTITERCLFFQLGEQFLGNVNADAFPEEWAPVLGYLAGEAEAVGLTPEDVRRVCGVGMYGRWFTRSQFNLLPAKHYAALQAAYPGHFLRPFDDVKAEWDAVKRGPRIALDARRSYFDNLHEAMTDVWAYPVVTGDERHGHATPKPVAMMVRAIKSACPEGGLVVEPFGGSGSTLIGAEACGRVCFTMELQPQFVDVIVRRWQTVSGGTATLLDGRAFDVVAAERAAANDNARETDAAA